MGSRSRKRFVLSGEVQGVGCRNQIMKRVTRDFDAVVHGFVRNLEDGRVEVVAEGSDSDLKRLAGLLERDLNYPVNVHGLEITEWNETEELTGFQIRS